MENRRPQQIKATHLARKAVVYVRQSTEKQVLANQGSTAYQRDQARFPREWGWPKHAIEVIDEDLGQSGGSTTARAGYLRMLQEIEAGTIGALFIADHSRAGRNAQDWLALIAVCAQRNVLLVVDGRVLDLRDNSERFVTQILASVGEHENEMRRETLQRARNTKARAGQAVSAPPCGYVRAPDGSWVMDSDPAVQATIRTVFRTYLECRSLYRTVVTLVREGVKLPRRDRRHGLRWVDPQIETVAVILRHPAYKGMYVYRRQIVDPTRQRDVRGRVRLRRAPSDEWIQIAAHHPPYVSEEEWDSVQTIRELRAPSPHRRNLGPGSALIQGIVRCGLHGGRAMASVYKTPRRDGTRTHAYFCFGDIAAGGLPCGRIPGSVIDRAVVRAALIRLRTPEIQAVRAAWEQARADERAQDRQHDLGLRRARQREADLFDRYMSVDPSNRLVAADVERALEAAKCEVRRLESGVVRRSVSTIFTEEAFTELRTLCENVPALWDAPTTRNEDRKELLRTMIREICIEGRDRYGVRLTIVWADATPECPIEVPLPPRAYQLIQELADEGISLDEIVRRISATGILTMRGKLWTRHAVREVILRKERGDAVRLPDFHIAANSKAQSLVDMRT